MYQSLKSIFLILLGIISIPFSTADSLYSTALGTCVARSRYWESFSYEKHFYKTNKLCTVITPKNAEKYVEKCRFSLPNYGRLNDDNDDYYNIESNYVYLYISPKSGRINGIVYKFNIHDCSIKWCFILDGRERILFPTGQSNFVYPFSLSSAGVAYPTLHPTYIFYD